MHQVLKNLVCCILKPVKKIHVYVPSLQAVYGVGRGAISATICRARKKD